MSLFLPRNTVHKFLLILSNTKQQNTFEEIKNRPGIIQEQVLNPQGTKISPSSAENNGLLKRTCVRERRSHTAERNPGKPKGRVCKFPCLCCGNKMIVTRTASNETAG